MNAALIKSVDLHIYDDQVVMVAEDKTTIEKPLSALNIRSFDFSQNLDKLTLIGNTPSIWNQFTYDLERIRTFIGKLERQVEKIGEVALNLYFFDKFLLDLINNNVLAKNNFDQLSLYRSPMDELDFTSITKLKRFEIQSNLLVPDSVNRRIYRINLEMIRSLLANNPDLTYIKLPTHCPDAYTAVVNPKSDLENVEVPIVYDDTKAVTYMKWTKDDLTCMIRTPKDNSIFDQLTSKRDFANMVLVLMGSPNALSQSKPFFFKMKNTKKVVVMLSEYHDSSNLPDPYKLVLTSIDETVHVEWETLILTTLIYDIERNADELEISIREYQTKLPTVKAFYVQLLHVAPLTLDSMGAFKDVLPEICTRVLDDNNYVLACDFSKKIAPESTDHFKDHNEEANFMAEHQYAPDSEEE